MSGASLVEGRSCSWECGVLMMYRSFMFCSNVGLALVFLFRGKESRSKCKAITRHPRRTAFFIFHQVQQSTRLSMRVYT